MADVCPSSHFAVDMYILLVMASIVMCVNFQVSIEDHS